LEQGLQNTLIRRVISSVTVLAREGIFEGCRRGIYVSNMGGVENFHGSDLPSFLPAGEGDVLTSEMLCD